MEVFSKDWYQKHRSSQLFPSKYILYWMVALTGAGALFTFMIAFFGFFMIILVSALSQVFSILEHDAAVRFVYFFLGVHTILLAVIVYVLQSWIIRRIRRQLLGYQWQVGLGRLTSFTTFKKEARSYGGVYGDYWGITGQFSYQTTAGVFQQQLRLPKKFASAQLAENFGNGCIPRVGFDNPDSPELLSYFYYNPKKPAQICLYPGLTMNDLFLIFSIVVTSVIMAVSVIVFYTILKVRCYAQINTSPSCNIWFVQEMLATFSDLPIMIFLLLGLLLMFTIMIQTGMGLRTHGVEPREHPSIYNLDLYKKTPIITYKGYSHLEPRLLTNEWDSVLRLKDFRHIAKFGIIFGVGTLIIQIFTRILFPR